jgi:riboflavin synthase
MFTGLVLCMAEVAKVEPDPPGATLVVRQADVAGRASLGDSICLAGCCLTVVRREDHLLYFQAGPETLARTTFGRLVAGDRVNLEMSLRAGDPLGGHFVTGHVDGVAYILERQDERDWSTLWIRPPVELLRQMASKGSIAVDGVSLTLVDVLADRFSVALIPHTLEITTLGRLAAGDSVNLETDLLAKYVERRLAAGEPRV